jgi:hypothetical protein
MPATERREGHGKLRVKDGKIVADRSPKDYAIEFGGYLAEAARNFQVALNSNDPEDRAEKWSALSNAIYEFEKRRDKALANL